MASTTDITESETKLSNSDDLQPSQPVLLTEGSFAVDDVPTEQKNTSETIPVASENDLKDETLSQKIDRLEELNEEEPQDELKYVPPLQDPYSRSVKYMEKHNVMQIFQHLTAEIVYHKPTDPLQHMLDELNRMVSERELKREETLKSAGIV
ncbi:uncharacterized protein [Asterias amurensis]|uniref:uncharacterized protein n=1 Tax=Asterias amurensis TaxID=7602 RepID=UPI003AB87E31